MTCEREFLAGAIAGGPVWILVFVGTIAALWLGTEYLRRRAERQQQLHSKHLSSYFRNEPPHE